MIIVKISGGLGNQMFQYAFGKCLGKKYGHEVKVDISWYDRTDERLYGLGVLDTPPEVASPKEIARCLFPSRIISFFAQYIRHIWRYSPRYIFEKEQFVFNETLSKEDNLYFDGYWQHYLYVNDWDTVSSSFQYTARNLKFTEELKERRLNSQSNIVIQIRGGDYINNSDVGNICDTEFFRKATSYIKEKVSDPYYLVFTDTPEYAKKVLQGLDINYGLAPRVPENPREDVELMSLCDYIITSNSTFGWWGAWLNKNPQRIIIGPKLWHRAYPNNSPIPETWIKL